MKNISQIKIITLLFFCFFYINSKSQCSANFSYSLNATGNVSFTNLSTGTTSNTLYYWSFGDNQNAIQANPNHTYIGNGSYVVTLMANDSITPCSSQISQTITVSNAVCLLNSNFNHTINTNGNVNFYNSSTGTIPATSYTLNFGDGNNAYYTNNGLNMASHTYTANGNYTAILYVENSSSCVSTYSIALNISIQPCTLTANFTYTVTNGTVNFTDVSLGTNSLTGYYWDFGNSNISFSQNPPVQTYLYNGQYTVSLNLNDSIISGCNSSVTKTITITNAPCFVTSTFSMSKDSAITTSIVWNAYPTYPANVSNVTWNWGDNSSSTGLYPTHTYSAAGFYNICLTVSVSCGSTTTTCLNTSIFKTNNNSLQMVTVNVLNISTGVVQYSESSDDIHLFPNPVKDILTIENNNLDLSITIIDITGKIVYRGGQKNNESKIDMRNFYSGIYFVKLSGENYYKTVKIIKD